MSEVRRLRVLVLASTYPRWLGDTEPGFVHELCKRLAISFDVRVVCPHALGAKRRESLDGVDIRRYRYAPDALETLVNHGGILTNLKRSPWKWLLVPSFLLGQAWAVRRAIKQFRPDAIHAHWMLPQGLLLALMRPRIPWMVTSHGADLFGLKGSLFAALRRQVMIRSGLLALVSRAMQQRVLAEMATARTAVMPMGVDTSELFVPDGSERESCQLLFVGRLVEKKGLAHLLHALPIVRECYPEVSLVIAGFGPEQERLEALVASLDLGRCVRFVGAVAQQDLPRWYRRATVFVAPFVEAANGDQEGLGLVVAEAMACACPVIVGDVPASDDLLASNAGMRVHSRDHQALATAIVDLLADPDRCAHLGQVSRRYAIDHFSWERVTDRYTRALNGLIAGRRVR